MSEIDTQIHVLETVLFTKIREKEITKAKPSQILPVMDIIAKEWNLNMKDNNQFKVTLKMLKHFAKWN